MLAILLLAAVLIAVAIVGIRESFVELGVRISQAILGIASLWLLGFVFYAMGILAAVLMFAAVIAFVVAVLKPSRQ